jgi:Protein of unknown function (DUF1116)
MALLGAAPSIVNIGLDLFATTLAALDVPSVHVEWRPPAGGDARLAALLSRLEGRRESIDRANAMALERLTGGAPFLVDCRPARDALELPDRTVLHSGPPLAWDRFSEPVRAAILGGIRYEGWAANDDAARAMVERGGVRLAPCHHHATAGPMAGVVTPSMPVFVVENRAYGTRGHATINEGLGKVLRYGANDDSVLARLNWIATEAGPLLGAGLRALGGIDLRALMAQAVRMGDEMHQRNIAATALLARAMMPGIAAVGGRHHAVARLAEFLAGNDQFFLNVAMAAGKSMVEPASDIAGSTLVSVMARNGTEFGIRVAGCGERWFTAPVNMPRGLYFPGFGADDANPDMGDSAIVETIGLGALSMVAAPAVARFLGAGGTAEAAAMTSEMREICAGEHPHFRIPSLDDRGAPVGIDTRLVVETSITPLINTGIASRRAGVGQIGAGVVRAPLACFTAALETLATDSIQGGE